MLKNRICNLILILLMAITVTGCGEYITDPTESAEKYVKKLIKEENYNLEVTGSALKYYGNLDKAKELYESEVENKSSIQDYCVINVTLVSEDGEESDYAVDCIKYNDKWRAMGAHSDYEESGGETNSAEELLPKFEIDGEN